jgi:drug/metabolite transporter (DMT)-like permease
MNGSRSTPGLQRGVLLAFGTAAISALSVYVNAFGVKLVPDAAVYTTAKNGIAALILVGLAMALGARHEVPTLGRRQRSGLVAIALIGGSVPFVLFFSGLALATAPTAAFIHKTLFVWVALMAVPLLGERLGLIPVAAMGVLLLGQVLMTPPTGMGWGPGETMIAAATLLWAVEVVVAKRLLTGVSAPLLAASRMGLGVVFLVGYLALSGRLAGLAALPAEALGWILATGVLLAGYVATWYGALRLAPATTVTSILVVAAVGTGVLSALTTGATPDPRVIAGYLLVIGAVAGIALSAGRFHPTHARPDVAATS